MGFFDKLGGFLNELNESYNNKLNDYNAEVCKYKREYEKRSDNELIRMFKEHQYYNKKQQMAIMSVLRDRGYGPKE